ncbi:hypothetical protein [Arhodomonas sp. AD133]|uniref:hypothetical protein n=1 Tax=Arhodomonas sp. AD133 TaxID=3415009 RepID=UPI003EB72724
MNLETQRRCARLLKLFEAELDTRYRHVRRVAQQLTTADESEREAHFARLELAVGDMQTLLGLILPEDTDSDNEEGCDERFC